MHNKTLLIGLDGIPASLFNPLYDDGELPHLRAAFEGGLRVRRLVATFPTDSMTCMPLMFQGRRVADLDPIAQLYYERRTERYHFAWDFAPFLLGRNQVAFPSSVLHDSRRSLVIGIREAQDASAYVPPFYFICGSFLTPLAPRFDTLVLRALPRLLARFDVVAYWTASCDHTAHSYGRQAMANALRQFDRKFGRLIAALPQDTTLLLLSDHGNGPVRVLTSWPRRDRDNPGGCVVKQFVLTTCAGKRLIGKAMAAHPEVRRVLQQGTLVIIAGTTNGYVAEEVLGALGQADGFSREGFRRGITVAPGSKAAKAEFPGDVIVRDGVWLRGKTIVDVANDLQSGDVVLKGANAFDASGHPAVQIGHPQGGTIMAALAAVIGRRVQLLVPVGLEKRVLEDVEVLAQRCNAPGGQGPRLLPIPARAFTELDAIHLLTGAQACLLAAGGVYGAEGSAWLGIDGTEAQVEAAAELIRSLAHEPPCQV